ncbi:cytochrome c oxidase subunit 7A-related protein, mitochondrial-like [Eublepharis macularius]|uniref:Cytochrome c oxidase subunit 7A2-like, mitochondrial n=1 Tax=Eublepharis macularius TaxID=481883 RepID=A0AA97J3G0_EUBMA|nr:cytochrome c oxidase subunit 7A-related protein, mitochondrial-like [Eublepharis macularius]
MCGPGELFPHAAVYYKFSCFMQRLVGAGTASAYTLQGFKPVIPMEPPALISGTPTKLASDSSAVEYLGKNKVRDLQKLFEKPDGVPVHVKQGVPDKLLYQTTMAIKIGGTIYCLIALYKAAHPERQK